MPDSEEENIDEDRGVTVLVSPDMMQKKG